MNININNNIFMIIYFVHIFFKLFKLLIFYRICNHQCHLIKFHSMKYFYHLIYLIKYIFFKLSKKKSNNLK